MWAEQNKPGAGIFEALCRAGMDDDRQFQIEYAEGNDDLATAVIRRKNTDDRFLFVSSCGIGGLVKL